jgi:hypothetical protein
MRSRVSRTFLLALAVMAALPAAASASANQYAIFQDDNLLVDQGDAVRDRTLDEVDRLGADVIKAQLSWSGVAPTGRRRPSGFDATDPSEYPGWARYDALGRSAQARGFRVMFALSPPFPGWATKRRGDRVGVNRPSAREFGRFAQAAALRYPSVDLWTLGNEPNHPEFLYPQSTRSRVPSAPHQYRAMVRSAVSGFNRAGASGDTILFGELLPIGKTRLGPKSNLRPLLFLREFFCLNSRLRPYSGRAARVRNCRRYRRLSGLDGFAYHPYTRPGGPRIKEPTSDDATIRSLGRVTRLLDAARRRGRIGGRRLPIWNTEFGYQSNPPDRFFGARLSRIPGFLAESELLLSLRNRRVASYSQYTMTDTAIVGGDTGSWQGGLRFASGRPKRGVYNAYRLPVLVRQLGPSAVEVVGAARPGGRGAIVQIQQRRGGRRYADLGGPLTVSNARGYFRARFRISRAAKRRYRILSDGHKSRTARPIVR